MPTIAHVSDLHLDPQDPKRQPQAERVLAGVNDTQPDLVVVTGDVTENGWDSIDELRWARAWLEERIDAPVRCVPGNHDVGNFVGSKLGAVEAARVTPWEDVFGGAWAQPLAGWTVLGLNSMILGSSLDAEAAQNAWLNEQLAQASGPIAVFLHSPLFALSPDEANDPGTAYWLGPYAARQALWQTLHAADVRLIGSGHVHQERLLSVGHTAVAWAPPASGTWVHSQGLPNPPAPEQTGFWLHTLDGKHAKSQRIACAAVLKCVEFTPWP